MTTEKQSKISLKHRLLAVAMMAMIMSEASAATLKPEVTLDANLTVGDLFDGVTAHADYVLAPAPAPGQVQVLRAGDLTRVATTFGIDWRPQTGLEQVVLKSATQAVAREDLLAALRDRLGDDGIDLQLPESLPVLGTSKGAAMTVESISVDQDRETFTARLSLGAGRFETVTGRAFAQVMVPVLKTAFAAGDMIGPADIEYVARRANSIPADTIVDTRRITGMTPRRAAAAGRPLQPVDLESPMMVKKGQMITLTLKNGPIALSLQGRALQNGGSGDSIRVLNPASNQVIEGIVSGFQTVSVAPPSNALAALN